MDIIGPLLNAAISLVSAYVGYILGRRSKIDEIQLAKRHELAEELSVLLQEDFSDRLNLRKEYHENFNHLKGLSEAMYYFDKHGNLYSGIRQRMDDISTRRRKLRETNQRAAIYLSVNTTSQIGKYLDLTDFTYTSDGVGYINDYAERLFEHVLDNNIWEQLNRLFVSISKCLRKAVA